ncbi:MarR family winged helix-turn-helix transcriptional regulator [Glycomyces buryatensis]|uniref:MarR family transcriptional regulator n=1 Tax=Glycomyces buryatensis TaxID=2570927 RepID=A0A4S8Q1W5_9ACTN|nr:MarR family transcriptional regulator [Glycomyces buryatensis]THV37091.1 MarR family transcriptional regulator [Glycomyces buryatensis]
MSQEPPDSVDVVLSSWARERPDLELWPLSVVARIMRFSRHLERELKEFLDRHNLEPGEFDLLTTLRRTGQEEGLTAGAFRRSTLVTAGAITNRIDKLTEKGLVTRTHDTVDRRVVRITLTDRGRTLIDTLLPEHLANYAKLLRPLHREEAEVLADTLRSILRQYGDTP